MAGFFGIILSHFNEKINLSHANSVEPDLGLRFCVL